MHNTRNQEHYLFTQLQLCPTVCLTALLCLTSQSKLKSLLKRAVKLIVISLQYAHSIVVSNYYMYMYMYILECA